MKNPPSTTVPSLEAGDPHRNALLKIATILNRADPLPQPTTTPTVAVPRVQTRIEDNPAPLARVPPRRAPLRRSPQLNPASHQANYVQSYKERAVYHLVADCMHSHYA